MSAVLSNQLQIHSTEKTARTGKRQVNCGLTEPCLSGTLSEPKPSSMKRRLPLLLTLALTLASPNLQSAEPLKAGAFAADITPKKWPLAVRGTFSLRLTETAHDPLHARSLVLDDGTTRLSLTTVDSVAVTREVFDKAKAIAAKKSGIPTSNMLMAATHTHTAPYANAQNGTPEELAYQKLLINGIADSVIRAAQNLQPAEAASSGDDLPEEVFNRRWFMQPGTIPPTPFGTTTDVVRMNPPRDPHKIINPAGPTDPEIAILSVRNAKGQPLCLLANYSLHYVGRVPSGQVSADYFGQFASLVENRLSRSRPVEGFVGIMSNGTSGDINNINFRNPRPPREPFEQIRIVAGKAADTAWRAYQKVKDKHEKVVPLGMVERLVTLDLRQATPEQIARAEKIIAMTKEDAKSLPRLAKSYAERTLKHAKKGKTIEIKIQAVRIGDLAIVSFPFEVFAETGLNLKDKSPFADTFIMELANGEHGYLPTPNQHKFGGYETWLTTNRVQLDASELLTAQLLEMLDELKKK